MQCSSPSTRGEISSTPSADIEMSSNESIDASISSFTRKPKSQKKRERKEAQREQRKEVRKMKRKAVKERRREERRDELAGLSAEEIQERADAEKAERIAEKERSEAHMQACYDEGNPIIAFNCGFTDQMQEKEITSLAKQLQLAYNTLKRSKESCVQFHLVGMDSALETRLHPQGYENWKVHIDKGPYWDTFAGHDIVVLTPDAVEDLEAVEKDKVYVIGGLVDRTIAKNETFSQANRLDPAPAAGGSIVLRKLPVREYLPNVTLPVLNINTVVEILFAVLEKGSSAWSEVLESLVPQRKQLGAGEGRKARRLEHKRQKRNALYGAGDGADPIAKVSDTVWYAGNNVRPRDEENEDIGTKLLFGFQSDDSD
ncbi:tRNA methyltransferase complex GCD14 subunit domain containing protein [Perkinsus marinus ATCC 50983]|uniref:tRNA (guanine(9)-N(1))-methyltransferase n=2 Tax=Perkinsus marinus (strain ATCC 50983 / TXsc) TaxID=423536 RepID=C5LH59_PERM5|nr:tRNA methyltransferase complex GCD14 subunit domain containing protein [Perkinsus marinus ATCC 50983]EER03868.1 tRNA methyltransferase complex GCD14 subunit domain containing protein [Perkinsus marinus ATCC 50983]|eukprot:XP_002772052.1 tRNA methyltransferase complex GCD14 subunit domain containing protein [Perkinsus marinus ATCC 50983]